MVLSSEEDDDFSHCLVFVIVGLVVEPEELMLQRTGIELCGVGLIA